MKKVFLLLGCLAILASCNKKKESNEAANAGAAVENTVEATAQQVVNNFLEENKIQAKSFGLRQNENGAWELNLKNLDTNGEAAGDLLKLVLADDAEIITLGNGTIATSALNDEVKNALNNKFVGYWLDGEKISHIVEFSK